MSYNKTQWLDRSDPLFNAGTSPEVDANNLNKIEEGILAAQEAINNLSTATGKIHSTLQQQIFTTESDLIWNLAKQSTDTNIFEFDDIQKTFTIKKAGTFNFSTYTTYGVGTSSPVLITTKIIDAFLDTEWHSDTVTLFGNIGDVIVDIKNKQLVFENQDVPKTLKIVQSGNDNNMYMNTTSYTLNTLTSGVDASDHSALTGRNDPNCHPISAITDLDDTLSGGPIFGQAV